MRVCCLRGGMLTLTLLIGGGVLRAGDEAPASKPSVTVFPVVITPGRGSAADSEKRIGIVVATLLERAGLTQLEVADTTFQPPESDDVAAVAVQFGKRVVGKPIETDYAVFVELRGTPKTGPQEIRTIVVDKSGKTVLAESAAKAEFAKAPMKPKDPMSCCVFVARRLQKLWDLDDPLRQNAPQGKMAQFWQKDAGIPSEAERAEIEKRRATLKEKIAAATCTVYPPRVGRASDKPCAVALAAMLGENELGKAEASALDPALKIAGHSNEQKVLWDTARAFRDFIKKNPPATDYALFADYSLFPTAPNAKANYVHLIVCDRSGAWVIVDYQNSHHDDFQDVRPKTTDDCNRLALRRLKRRLSE